MRCPYCSSSETKVIDKRDVSGSGVSRRRRECLNCGKRFTTYERIESIDLNVKKSDGRIEQFSADKLRESILKACDKRSVSAEQIDDMVNDIESTLKQQSNLTVDSKTIGSMVMDRLKLIDKVSYLRYASVHLMFSDINAFEHEIEKLRLSSLPEGNPPKMVRKRSGFLVDFDKSKIAESIWKAAQAMGGKDRSLADKLADEVTRLISQRFPSGTPSVEDVQDAVEEVLTKHGHYKTVKAYILYRAQRKRIRESKDVFVDVNKLIDGYMNKSDWRVKENSNTDFSFSGLMLHTAGAVIANYVLNEVYPPEIKDAHYRGFFHIHDLSAGVVGYSFYRNESVIVRKRGSSRLLCLSLEQLYDLVNAKVVNENGFEIKYTNDYEILDEKGWTGIKRVLRHKSTKKLMSFNSFNGHNLIVTEDHPFITLADEKPSIKCSCGGEVFKNRSNRNGYGGNTFKRKVFSPGKERLETLASNIKLNNYVLTPKTRLVKTPEFINLSNADAWFIGLFIAEGYRQGNYLAMELKSGSPELEKVYDYFQSKNIEYLSYERVRNSPDTLMAAQQGVVTLKVNVNSLSPEVMSCINQVRNYSENKNLPIDFLNYDNQIVGSMVSGVIDGDGTVRNNDRVSRVVIRLTSKTLLSQIQFWLSMNGIKSSLSTIDSFGKREYNGRVINPKKQLYRLSIFIPESRKEIFTECIKINNEFKYSGEHIFDEYSPLRKIEYVANDSEFVYDITTESHTFICNGVLSHNCAGWSLQNLLIKGFGGVRNKVDTVPAKHLDVVVGQMVNFIGCLQMEWAGAQAFSSVDTFLAPFVKADHLSYKDVKQQMQKLIYNLNIPSRWGSQMPFSNLTFDLTVPEDMKNERAIVGGKLMDFTYGDCQKEMDMINLAFLEVMMHGDAKGRIFTFPIPTYNLTRDFNWDSPVANKLFEVTAKYGLPYFQNYIGSNLDPRSIRAMCCRLNLNLKELMNRPGGGFGPGDSTGSIGVVTINVNRLAYLAKGDKRKYFESISHFMELAKRSLEIKRKLITRNLEMGLMPYTKVYLGTFRNHFNTIGLVGMNEACVNFLGKDITTPEGKEFAIETLKFMREKLKQFQVETGHLYNLEATPAESTSYRLARLDKKYYPDIYTSGEKEPYLTNSTQLPVDYTDDVFKALEHQNDLQPLYTGGTMFHTFLGEAMTDGESCKRLVKKIAYNTRLPYFSITPTFSICPIHGYLRGEHFECPICAREEKKLASKDTTDIKIEKEVVLS